MTVDHGKNIIEVRNISLSLGDREVLQSVSLDIHPGDYLAIIGPNGAGKTTLLKVMLGLIKPDQGEVKLFGQELEDFNDYGKISYIAQQASFFDRHFPATVYDIAAMGRYGGVGLLKRLSSEDHQAIREALEQVGMWEKKDNLIGKLSGGQQQRTFIARALAGHPEVMFLDEPTRGLDQKSQQDYYALLKDLNKQGLTIVLVTHDIARATKDAMHIACLDKHLACHNSPQEFLADSELVERYGENIMMGHHHH